MVNACAEVPTATRYGTRANNGTYTKSTASSICKHKPQTPGRDGCPSRTNGGLQFDKSEGWETLPLGAALLQEHLASRVLETGDDCGVRQPGVPGGDSEFLLLDDLQAFYDGAKGNHRSFCPIPQYGVAIATELDRRYPDRTLLELLRILLGPGSCVTVMQIDDDGCVVEQAGPQVPSWAGGSAEILETIGACFHPESAVHAGYLQDAVDNYLNSTDEEEQIQCRRAALEQLHESFLTAKEVMRTGKVYRVSNIHRKYRPAVDAMAVEQGMEALEESYLGSVLAILRHHPVVQFLQGKGHRIACIPGAVPEYLLCMRGGGNSASARAFAEIEKELRTDAQLGTSGDTLASLHGAMQAVAALPGQDDRVIDAHLDTVFSHPLVADDAPYATLAIAEEPLTTSVGTLAALAGECAWVLLQRGRPTLALEICSRYAGRRTPQNPHPSKAWATDNVEAVRVAACACILEQLALNSSIAESTLRPAQANHNRFGRAPVLEFLEGPVRKHAFKVAPTAGTAKGEEWGGQRSALWGGKNWAEFCQLTGYQGSPEQFDPYGDMEKLLRVHLKDIALYFYDGLWSDGGGAGTPAAVAALRHGEVRSNTGYVRGTAKLHEKLQNTFAALSVPIVSAAMGPGLVEMATNSMYYVTHEKLAEKARGILRKVLYESVGEALDEVVLRRKGDHSPYYSPRREGGSWAPPTLGMEHDYQAVTAMHDTHVI